MGDDRRRRPVFVSLAPQRGDVPESERARRFDRIMGNSHADPGRPTPGATAEATLAGLIDWVKQWIAHPANDDARVILMYDPGYRDERAAMFNAVCDPEAFVAMVAMATPDEWRKGEA